jgi:hypothetical protein
MINLMTWYAFIAPHTQAMKPKLNSALPCLSVPQHTDTDQDSHTLFARSPLVTKQENETNDVVKRRLPGQTSCGLAKS